MSTYYLVQIGLLMAMAQAAAVGMPRDGQTLVHYGGGLGARACVECHGRSGTAPSFPRLAGQREESLVQHIRDFADGRRSNPEMSAVAARLLPEEVLGAAGFYSRQRFDRAMLAGAGPTSR